MRSAEPDPKRTTDMREAHYCKASRCGHTEVSAIVDASTSLNVWLKLAADDCFSEARVELFLDGRRRSTVDPN
jgi:hypothetical protein